MNVGKMRTRIQIQADQGNTVNGMNEPVENWQTIATVWCEFLSSASREATFAKSLIGSSTHVIRMRYFTGLTNKHRVKLGEQIYSIDGVDDPKKLKVEMIVTCTERANVITS